MSDSDPTPGSEAVVEPTGPDEAATPAGDAAPAALGLFRFTTDGRRAPAIFVVGWLATLLGGGITAIGIMAAGGSGAGSAGDVLFFGGLAVLSIGFVLLAGAQSIERKAAGLAWPGPSPVLVFATCVSASFVVAGLVGAPLAALGVRLPGPLLDLVAVTLQAVVFAVVVHVTVVASGALDVRSIGLGARGVPMVRDLLAGALWAGPVILVSAVLAAILVPLVGATPPSPLPPTGSGVGLLLHLLAGAVIAPVAEEIVFRGVAVSAWARMAGPTAAIVRSSILFAIAHVLVVGGDTFGDAAALAFVGAAARLPVAVVLAWIYLRRGTLWAPIGLHAAFNAVLIVLGEAAAAG